MYNKTILIGRLTRDPELHSSDNGNRATFSLAVDREFEIEGQPAVDYFDIVAFKERANFVGKWFKKGMLVLVEGRLQSRKWKDRDGNNRISVEVVVEKTRFAEPKRKENISDSHDSGPSA